MKKERFIQVDEADAIAQLPRVCKLYDSLSRDLEKINDELALKLKLRLSWDNATQVDYKQMFEDISNLIELKAGEK